MRGLTMLVLMALAACAPVAPTPTAADEAGEAWSGAPPVTLSDAEIAACDARGGTVRPVCMMGTPQCVVAYADAGRACRDGDDCQGDCRAEEMGPYGQAAVGRCQASSDPCGCFANVEDGRIDAALCVD